MDNNATISDEALLDAISENVELCLRADKPTSHESLELIARFRESITAPLERELQNRYDIVKRNFIDIIRALDAQIAELKNTDKPSGIVDYIRKTESATRLEFRVYTEKSGEIEVTHEDAEFSQKLIKIHERNGGLYSSVGAKNYVSMLMKKQVAEYRERYASDIQARLDSCYKKASSVSDINKQLQQQVDELVEGLDSANQVIFDISHDHCVDMCDEDFVSARALHTKNEKLITKHMESK